MPAYSAGTELDIRTCLACGWSTSGFTADTVHPGASAANLWRDWLRYMLDGTFDPSHRVYCGITLPHVSTNLSLARIAAEMAGYAYGENESAIDICNAVVAAWEATQ